MTITDVIRILQEKHAAVEGIKQAPIAYPGSLPETPMALTYPDEGTWVQDTFANPGHSWGITSRTYVVQVYVEPVGQGTVDSGLQECIALIERFGLLYLELSNNGLTIEDWPVLQIGADSPARDTGIRTLEYEGNVYRGFQLTVTVQDEIREALQE